MKAISTKGLSKILFQGSGAKILHYLKLCEPEALICCKCPSKNLSGLGNSLCYKILQKEGAKRMAKALQFRKESTCFLSNEYDMLFNKT